MKTLSCEQCGTPVYINDKFCPHCGTPLNKNHENCVVCETCQHKNLSSSSFCEKCGTGLIPKSTTQKIQANDSHKIVSQGNYSGKMIRGKTSKSWKTLKIIILIFCLLAVIALIIWFNTDPDAKEKLGNILFSAVVMLLFGSYIWWRSKKGTIKASAKRKTNYDYDDNDEPEVDRDDD